MAAFGHPSEVLLTDGNVTSSENLERVCQSNLNLVGIVNTFKYV